jgi:tricorn protease
MVGAPSLTTRGQRHVITRPVLHDVRPAFDPDGKYLYFLSYREFNPVYDGLHFDLGFPWGMRPYLLTLRADLPNPFIPVPDLAGDEEGEDEGEEGGAEDAGDEEGGEETGDGDAGDEDGDDRGDDDHDDEEDDEDDDDDDDDDDDEEELEDDEDGSYRRIFGYARRATRTRALAMEAPSSAVKKDGHKDEAGRKSAEGKGKKEKSDKPKPMKIDLDGIEQRVLACPVPDGRYGQIAGIPNKALFTVYAIQGQLDGGYEREEESGESGSLRAYDFKEYRSETLAENVSSFEVSANLKKLIYWSRNQLRVINAGEKAPGGVSKCR